MAIEAGAAYWGGPTASDIEAMGVPWGCALGALVATRRAAVVTRRADVVTRAAVLGMDEAIPLVLCGHPLPWVRSDS